MSRECVPHVVLEIYRSWKPLTTRVKTVTINSDAAACRAQDAARKAVEEALESKTGSAEVRITVRRKASKPTGVRLIRQAEQEV